MVTIQRIQTGIRLEKNMVKVLKGLAEHHNMSLGDLIEGIVLHAFENKTPFSKSTLEVIKQLRKIYGFKLDSKSAHQLKESNE